MKSPARGWDREMRSYKAKVKSGMRIPSRVLGNHDCLLRCRAGTDEKQMKMSRGIRTSSVAASENRGKSNVNAGMLGDSF